MVSEVEDGDGMEAGARAAAGRRNDGPYYPLGMNTVHEKTSS